MTNKEPAFRRLFLFLLPPEAPGTADFEGFVEFLGIEPVVEGDVIVGPSEVALPVFLHEERMLPGQAQGAVVHPQEAVQQREHGKAAVRAVEPEIIGAPGAETGGFGVCLEGFLIVPYPLVEEAQALVVPAPVDQPGDFVVQPEVAVLEPCLNPLHVRSGQFFHQGGNHPDAAVLRPGHEFIRFVIHNTQYLKELLRIPGPPLPSGYNTPWQGWAIARIGV